MFVLFYIRTLALMWYGIASDRGQKQMSREEKSRAKSVSTSILQIRDFLSQM